MMNFLYGEPTIVGLLWERAAGGGEAPWEENAISRRKAPRENGGGEETRFAAFLLNQTLRVKVCSTVNGPHRTPTL
jgi:hypothetical protein